MVTVWEIKLRDVAESLPMATMLTPFCGTNWYGRRHSNE
jgi:hypothetical protein